MTRTIVSIAHLAFSFQAFAATECYHEGEFPAALQIESAGHGVNVVLGGNAASGHPRTAPVVNFDGKRWTPGERRQVVGEAPACDVKIPLPEMAYQEAIGLRDWAYFPDAFEQKVSVCERHGDTVFFGIDIYQGEGISGIGGVGRYDLKTGKLEVRRPLVLRDSLVTAIAYDGQYLWLGTAAQFECMGPVPTHGLIRYEWDTGLVAEEKGFCGFVVHDLRVVQGKLWAASDMGVSRRWTDDYMAGWHHWAYDPAGAEPMRQEGCMNLYTRLLRTLSREPRPAGSAPLEYFLEGLVRVNPEAAVAILQKQLGGK